MPPWRKYSTSLGVSMRRAGRELLDLARSIVALTLTSLPVLICAMPGDLVRFLTGEPEGSARSRRF